MSKLEKLAAQNRMKHRSQLNEVIPEPTFEEDAVTYNSPEEAQKDNPDVPDLMAFLVKDAERRRQAKLGGVTLETPGGVQMNLSRTTLIVTGVVLGLCFFAGFYSHKKWYTLPELDYE